MKTLLLGVALTLVCFITSAQDQKTTLNNIAVVTTAVGKSAQLSWKKGAEDIAYFIIERSEDGVDFRQCGIVLPSEDPEFNDYKFRDRLPETSQGMIYRIGVVTPQKRVYYLPNQKLLAPGSR